MNKEKIETALWLLKMWLVTIVMFGTASLAGGYLGYLAALHITGE